MRHIFAFVTSRHTSNEPCAVHAFKQSKLTPDELRNGCRLGLDSWADTCCAGKHAHVESFIEGRSVNAHGFSSSLSSLKNLPIANVLYAYDTHDGETFLLEVNNAIYMGSDMEDSLLCPNQCREEGIQIDTRPKLYHPDEPYAQTLIPRKDIVIPLYHHGPVPYLQVRYPTMDERLHCERLRLTPPEDWNPYDMDILDNSLNVCKSHITAVQTDSDFYDCPISYSLLHDTDSAVFDDIRHVFEIKSDQTASKVISSTGTTLTPEDLSKLWRIGILTAKRTLNATTHQCIRTTGALTRRFRTDKAHMRYKTLTTKQGLFYVDTLFAKVKSIRGFTCGNLFTNCVGFRKFFPMDSQKQSVHSLQHFIEVVGLPHAIHSDNHKSFMEGNFRRHCRKYHIKQTFTEPYSPWQNRAEGGIREVKSYAKKIMEITDTPIRLWCFAFEYAADLLSLMATSHYQLGGWTPYEILMCYTPDISEYTTFQWYQWAYYWDQINKEKKLCRWIGVAHEVGQSMCYWVLTEKGEAIARSSVVPVPDDDLQTTALQERMTNFTKSVHDKIGNHTKAIIKGETVDDDQIYHFTFNIDKADEDNITFPWDDDLADLPLQDESETTLESLDKYINAHVELPDKEGVPVLCRVKGIKRHHNGEPVGEDNANPVLSTRIYHVEFLDGRIEEYSANMIAESIYASLDEEGNSTGILDEIVDYRKSEKAVKIEDGFKLNTNGTKIPVITTKGWDLCIRWKDGSYDWIPLSQLKNSNPIETAEFAFHRGLEKEPAFAWWARKTLRLRDRMIHKVKTRRQKKPNMKFGIIIPEDYEEAIKLDERNKNTFWRDAVEKEFKDVNISFKKLESDEEIPKDHKEITCHLVYEVKFDLRRKARYVAGGHLTDPPTYMTYSSVVSQDSVRIAFLLAALNGLDVLAGDIQNAYLNAPTREKVWFRAGKEWGDHYDKPILIVRALYGLKSSGREWRNHLAETLKKLGFTSSLADPDVWYKPETTKDGKNIGPPTVYLGANIQKLPSRSPNVDCWGTSAEQYVRDCIKNIKTRLKESGFEFNKKLSSPEYKARQPFSNVKYRPELDVSSLCTDTEVTFFQNLIGILRWIIELGRIDIAYEVSILSSYLVNPRIGHLNQALHIIKYLDLHRENFISFDPTYLHVTEPLDQTESSAQKRKEMKEFYLDAEESIPLNAPEPRGEPVQINVFVDASHAGDMVTRRSHTGILIFLNMAPVIWYSKRQNTVESSTYSSEFIALKTAVEQIIALRYKLRMFGVPIDGPANIFCDNQAVYRNSSFATSTLKKKHNSIAYHRVREAVAAGICNVYKEDTESNLSDILTKSLAPDKREYMKERLFVNVKVHDLKDDK